MAVKIVVSGNGEIKCRPDLGVVGIRVEATGSDQVGVSSEARETVKHLHDQIQPLVESAASSNPSDETQESATATSTAAVAKWSSGSMSTYSYDGAVPAVPLEAQREAGAKPPRVYVASINVSVTFRDFDKLTEFTTAMSVVPNVTLQDVEWQLSDQTQQKLQSTVIQQAYRDAETKAKAFAEALGTTQLTTVEINQDSHQPPMFSAFAMGGRAMAMAADDGGQDGPASCVPQDVPYSLECRVVFEAN